MYAAVADVKPSVAVAVDDRAGLAGRREDRDSRRIASRPLPSAPRSFRAVMAILNLETCAVVVAAVVVVGVAFPVLADELQEYVRSAARARIVVRGSLVQRMIDD